MQQTTFLHSGSVIRGGKFTYTIQSVLGQGSFGITYLATTRAKISGDLGNIETEIKVAVKEFFMHEFCSRHADGTVTEMSEGSLVGGYARKFRKEAENLAKLSHPGIVRVLEVFEANNTCYYSMEYIDGGSLDAYVKQCGGLPEQEATACIRQIADALGYMHRNSMLHLDLKPLNVMRSADGRRMVLIDFGLSKQYDSNGEPESSTTIGLGTPGYAPIEQAEHKDDSKDFRPTLDIYALGATLYKLLTGNTPPKATEVTETMLNGGNIIRFGLQSIGISATVSDVVSKAMHPSWQQRIQTVGEFVSLLPSESDEETEPTKPVTEPISEQPPTDGPDLEPPTSPNPGKKGFPEWVFGVLAVLVAVTAVVLFANRSRSGGGIEPLVPTLGDTIQTASVSVQPEPAGQPAAEKPSLPEKPAIIVLESISLSKTTLTLDEGETSTLTVKYTPGNATDRPTTWKSTDASVARVSSTGKVTAVKSGSAAIIATCQGKDAYCNVTVKQKQQEPQPSKSEPTQAFPAAAPQSSASSSASSTTGTHNGHEWVDLGLSVKWATMNVGATSPSDYGSYFAWGETSPKSSYEWENLKYRTSGDLYDNVKFSKYVTESKYGTIDNKTVLDLSDDAARANWGGSWRMPTIAEFLELIDKCTWTWTKVNGKSGYKVVSKSNGNSIFLPAAGWRIDTSLSYAGSCGYYWSSSLSESGSLDARCLDFNSGGHSADNDGRYDGYSVRPVFR